jgi:ABC transporter DrrB family efflux protein
MTTAPTATRHLGRALTHTGVITRRNLLANVRLPDVLILSTIQPVVFMLMFLYVFGGAIQAALPAAAQGDYVYWLIPGILAQSAVFGSAPTAYGLNNDTTTGVLDRFRSLPMARSAVLAGRTLSDLVRSTFILSLQLAVGIVLGFRWQNGLTGLLAAIAVALAFGYACSWLMAYIGLTIRNSEAIQAAIYLVVFPMTLTSSVFLPTQTMPGWLQAFAEHQPITIIANALRALTLGQGALPAGHTVTGETMLALTWTAGILAVFALYRSKTRFRLRSLGILVDHSVEDASTSYPHGGQIRDRRGGHVQSWRALFTALMWPVFVVVPHVFVERGEQVPRVVDQDPVQAFPADRTHPAFRVRVGRRSQLHRARMIGSDVFG